MLEHLLLLDPNRVQRLLDAASQRGWATPNRWQVQLGVLRMWHRILFRSDTIGTCSDQPVRSTWRARLLRWRPLRFPFLLKERAIMPWDLSGLASSEERLVQHVLAAHHDRTQCVYDLQILSLSEGWLEKLEEALVDVVDTEEPRAEWLKDLTVFEGYHEAALEAVRAIRSGAEELNPDDAHNPDISFRAYLAWCAAQPPTPADTWRSWRAGALPAEVSS